VARPGIHAVGHIQSSDQPENRRANDKFQSSAGIGRLPLEGPQSGSASNFRSWPWARTGIHTRRPTVGTARSLSSCRLNSWPTHPLGGARRVVCRMPRSVVANMRLNAESSISSCTRASGGAAA